MQVPNLDQPRPDQAARGLAALLDDALAPWFAVLDGGLFDDLPGDLLRQGIACRSLFLDHADREVEQAGPWLVAADEDRARRHVVDLTVAQPCAVFWGGAEGDLALWRHLRTLNEVLIPAETVQDGGDGSGRGRERVLFRHWDPNVLASVLPLLDAAQLARVLGPARSIVMNAPDYGGLTEVPRPSDLPPPRGPLRLAQDQMEELKGAMLHASRLRIARFLKSSIQAPLPEVSDDYLWRATLASEPTADELGLRTEQGRARWTYLLAMSGGQVAAIPEVRAFIREGGASPDDQMKALMGHAITAMRGYDPGPGRMP